MIKFFICLNLLSDGGLHQQDQYEICFVDMKKNEKICIEEEFGIEMVYHLNLGIKSLHHDRYLCKNIIKEETKFTPIKSNK